MTGTVNVLQKGSSDLTLCYEGTCKWNLIYTKCEELEIISFSYQKLLYCLKQKSGIFMTGLKTALRGSDKALLEQEI